MSALNHVAQSPIIGAYSQISGGTGTGHMHNTHLDMVASYGIPVMVLMCVLLQKYLHQDGKIYTNKNDFIYILGFACSIMLGIGEAALFSGGIGIYVFIGAFLMMTNYTEKQTRDG